MRRTLALALLALAAAGAAHAEPLTLEVRRIEAFGLGGGAPPGPLEFVGGLQLSSANSDFGGLSGIEVTGDQAVMISDNGSYVRARLVHEDGRLASLADAEIAPLFPDGNTRKAVSDVEDLALDPGDPARGVVVRERQANAMLRFRIEGGAPMGFEPVAVGAPNRLLRSNRGLESVAYAPPGSPLAGRILAVAERPPRGETLIPAWIVGAGRLSIVRHDGFDVSAARFLPDGDLILLERRFSPASGIALRLRRIAGAGVTVGATLDGDYILDAGMTSQIDNMEGLAVSRDAAGRILLTLVSDDNYSILQRTLILQFALQED